jgi:hypothetical protein
VDPLTAGGCAVSLPRAPARTASRHTRKRPGPGVDGEDAMYRITRFNVIKTSNVVAVIYMLIVAIFVIPFLILGFLFGATGSPQAQQSWAAG